MKSQEKTIQDLKKIDPKNLPELLGLKEKQIEIVKNNPFLAISDTETYENAKKHRTALVSARTDLQKQEITIASQLKAFRIKVGEATNDLIKITLPHEEKQQTEVKRFEQIKADEKERKEEEERQRVLAIKKNIGICEDRLQLIVNDMDFNSIENCFELFNSEVETQKNDFYFAEFFEIYENAVLAVKNLLINTKSYYEKEEKQRIENQRLSEEAEKAKKELEAAKEKQRLDQEKFNLEKAELEAKQAKKEKLEAEKQKIIDAENAKKNKAIQEKLDELEKRNFELENEKVLQQQKQIEVISEEIVVENKTKEVDFEETNANKFLIATKADYIINALQIIVGFDQWYSKLDVKTQAEIKIQILNIIQDERI